jgi:DNA-binding beta-propeller fold protein YncE
MLILGKGRLLSGLVFPLDHRLGRSLALPSSQSIATTPDDGQKHSWLPWNSSKFLGENAAVHISNEFHRTKSLAQSGVALARINSPRDNLRLKLSHQGLRHSPVGSDLRSDRSENRTKRKTMKCPWRLLIASAVATIVSGFLPAAQGQTHSAGLLNFSSDGNLVACSNRDSGTVTIINWPEMKVLHEIPVGVHPEGVAWIGTTHKLACCVYGDDRIAILEADSGAVERTINVFDEPYGIVSAQDGSKLYATLEFPGQVIQIDLVSGDVSATWQVGQMPRGLAISRDGSFLLVTEYQTSRILKISTADGTVQQTWDGASTDNLARQVVLAPDDQKAYFTHIRSRVSASHGSGSIFPYVSVARLAGEKAGTRMRVPMDSFQSVRVTANPWDCDISPDGRRVCVVFAGTNDMFVCRVVGDDYVELEFERNIRLGNNPRSVRFSPDGSSVLIYNALDFDIVALRVPDGEEIGRVAVTKNPLSEELLLGKKLFYTALQPMSSRNWISCASCHPDGDADGRTWQQPEGLRNTQPLAGLSWTHPVHWSADRDEVQDFEHTIQGLLMQGQGFVKKPLPDALGEPIGGRNRALDALAEYTNSHKYSLSPFARNGLTESAQRGQQLFLSAETQCAKCHSGPIFSDSQPRPASEIVRHDVGTGQDDPSELMEPMYDTPTLLGIYRSAPYLHHGKAETLHDVLTTFNKHDQHGTTSNLTDGQVADLVEFLKALPFEDPEPAAKAAGLKQVKR